MPGQQFELQHPPVVPSATRRCSRWRAPRAGTSGELVESFAEQRPDDRHFVLDAGQGRVELGPAVREGDGTLRHYGAVPPKGAHLRLRVVPHRRRPAGQRRPAGRSACSSRRSPTWPSVENRRAALGGVDGEAVESAKVRAPILLRTRGRAVTAEDYEQLAREAAPEVARVRCAAHRRGHARRRACGC